MKLFLLTLVLGPLPALALEGEDWKISGSIETTLWLSGEVPPAFLESDGVLFDPRLSLAFDWQPDPRFFLHATLRADRGFDPGTHPDGRMALDEFIVRYRPFGDSSLNIQAGKFPTVVGNWVPDHRFHDDAFLLAPLPYATVNGMNVNSVAANSPAAIEARSLVDGATIHRLKENWSSIIWGPAYSNGISVFGNFENFDYAFEVKNAALGSQPSEWDFGDGDLSHPTFAARIGYRPDAAWAFGLSASHGTYLNDGAMTGVGHDRGDYTQSLVGLDVRWAHHDWVLSGEMFYSGYETPDDDFRVFAYYLQARYKAAPGLWFAGRFGQTFSNDVGIPSGGEAPWSPDYLRAEFAVGWRVTPDLLIKSEYARTVVTNDLSEPSKNLFGLSVGWRF